MEEMVTQTAEAQRRLKGTEIGKYWKLAEKDKGLQEFCDFISTQFGSPTLVPMGFIQLVANSLADLELTKTARTTTHRLTTPPPDTSPCSIRFSLGSCRFSPRPSSRRNSPPKSARTGSWFRPGDARRSERQQPFKPTRAPAPPLEPFRFVFLNF